MSLLGKIGLAAVVSTAALLLPVSMAHAAPGGHSADHRQDGSHGHHGGKGGNSASHRQDGSHGHHGGKGGNSAGQTQDGTDSDTTDAADSGDTSGTD